MIQAEEDSYQKSRDADRKCPRRAPRVYLMCNKYTGPRNPHLKPERKRKVHVGFTVAEIS